MNKCCLCGKKAKLFHCTFTGGAKVICCCLCGVTNGLQIGDEVKSERQQVEEKH